MDYIEACLPVLKASAVAVVCLVVTVILYGVTMSVKRRKLPPGPFPLPIVGNIPLIGTHAHSTYAKMAETYGHIFTLYIGSARVVVVTNAAMAREVLLEHDEQCCSRPIHDLMFTGAKYMNPGGHSSFAVAIWGPKVREMRQLSDRHMMLPRRLQATRSSRHEEVWRAVRMIEKEAVAGKPIDMRYVTEELGLRLSCRINFDKALVGLESTGESELTSDTFWKLSKEHMLLLAMQNPSDVIPFLKIFGDLFGVNKRWKNVFTRYLQLSDGLKAWYRKNEPNAHLEDELSLDYLQLLMRKAEEGSIPQSAVNEQNTESLVAGADTMSVSLEWTLLELMRHPHMMQRLREELDAKYGDSSPVEEDSSLQLPYLQAVVKESLRLHHSAPLAVPHYCTEDTVIAGYLIPAGTAVIIDLYAIQRNPEDWGVDAAEFNPDRFLKKDMDVTGSTDLRYLPFGAGRRICPGRQMAVKCMSLAIAALVHAFDWEAIPGEELSVEEAAGGVNLRSVNPLVLRARPRPLISLYH